MRFRDIAAFVLHVHATFSHPTSCLPKISPCSHGSGIRWMAFGLPATMSEGVWLIVRVISFRDLHPVLLIHQRYRQRRTDGRTSCNRNTALCSKVHRAVKTSEVRKSSVCSSSLSNRLEQRTTTTIAARCSKQVPRRTSGGSIESLDGALGSEPRMSTLHTQANPEHRSVSATQRHN